MLVARCQVFGWDISRETLAKVETQFRWIADFELFGFARALGVPVEDLCPPAEKAARLLKAFFEESGSNLGCEHLETGTLRIRNRGR